MAGSEDAYLAREARARKKIDEQLRKLQDRQDEQEPTPGDYETSAPPKLF